MGLPHRGVAKTYSMPARDTAMRTQAMVVAAAAAGLTSCGSALVEDYEDENVKIPDASGGDVLRELLRVNDLSQAKLEKDVGIMPSTLSELVNRRRRFTTDHMVALGKFFGVSPAVFLLE
jgi:antitoxin component HigA of HigAB toxin-antitoxin module